MTHPLTTERIADIQARIRDQRYKQRGQPEFQLARVRTQVLQNDSAGPTRNVAKFTDQAKTIPS
jgi:predicted Zn-dependent protease